MGKKSGSGGGGGRSGSNSSGSNSNSSGSNGSGGNVSGSNSSGGSNKSGRSKSNGNAPTSSGDYVFSVVYVVTAAYIIYRLLCWAYRIRLLAIEDYGAVIHEFDPYFNFRATEYLYEHGWRKFFTWFDYMVWYPLGRPVGTTIYPGMQFTAVFIKQYILPDWSLNNVCVYMPAWFGAFASFLTGLIAYECSLPENTNSDLVSFLVDLIKAKPTNPAPVRRTLLPGITTPALECAIAAMAMMSIVPAHLMRSVGGGYDNESVAVSAMIFTFYLWVRSLRNNDPYSWLFGIPCGLAYFYMVAAWGGYIFVLNMVGAHAAALVLMGRFKTKVYLSYSLFYAIGTVLAIQIPVVGWSPLKSLEQLGACAVFLGYQVLQFCEVIKHRRNLSRAEAWKLRIQVGAASFVLAVCAVWVVAPSGYFGPLSSRVRGLFVQHTKTGNPLVDSVAEHQPASSQAYFQYLHHVCSLAILGYVMVMFQLSDASSFLLAWGLAAYFFSHRMVRLILLTAPIASTLGGVAAGRILAWSIRQLWDSSTVATSDGIPTASPVSGAAKNGGHVPSTGKEGTKRKRKKQNNNNTSSMDANSSSFAGLETIRTMILKAARSQEGVIILRTVACMVFILAYLIGNNFKNYCWRLAKDLSHPSIIVKARTREGQIVKVDDYREAYWWLRDNTPQDARIMAWWDYGYQITAIANRTTIADGNTWNHEHIALLGKALTTDIDEGHQIARHLADYVLLWGGGGGDDLAKSPHLARIANSVYRDHCPRDPTCRAFGFVDRRGTPSPMMERSLLYQLHSHNIRPGVHAAPDLFQEVFRSKYGRVRIYRVLGVDTDSKRWVADPKNRKCDTKGSWFCPGQYPPGLSTILSRKKDFAQLEDFNRRESDDQYQKEYFENLKNPELARQRALREELQKKPQAFEQQKRKTFTINPDGTTTRHDAPPQEQEPQQQQQTSSPQPRQAEMERVYSTWQDTDETTLLWSMISQNEVDDLRTWIESDPMIAYVRSKDGRGPMWWAFEARNQEIVKLLMKVGVPHTDKDAKGFTPVDLLQGG